MRETREVRLLEDGFRWPTGASLECCCDITTLLCSPMFSYFANKFEIFDLEMFRSEGGKTMIKKSD